MPLVDLSLEQWKLSVQILKNYRAHLIAEGNLTKVAETTKVIEYIEDMLKKQIQ